MTWVLIVVLVLTTILFFALYQRCLKESRNLTSLLLQVLLDKEACNAQRTALYQFVSQSSATDALQLGGQTQIAMGQLAHRLGGSAIMASHGLLWKLKQEQRAMAR